MGLRYSPNGKPICYESADVRVIAGARDIPYTGALAALLVPTDSTGDCQLLGVIVDQQRTLIVDCLHGESEIRAFRAACSRNGIGNVKPHPTPIKAPCPPPPNQMQVETWASSLFGALVGGDNS